MCDLYFNKGCWNKNKLIRELQAVQKSPTVVNPNKYFVSLQFIHKQVSRKSQRQNIVNR